jgi:Mn2+/Fe2+ NRAMP family transporter
MYGIVFAIVSVVLQVFVAYKILGDPQLAQALSFRLRRHSFCQKSILARSPAAVTLVPNPLHDRKFIAALIAVLGITINPYLFFWQSGANAKDRNRYLPWKVVFQFDRLQSR